MAVRRVLTRIQFYWLLIASVHTTSTAEKVNICHITPSEDPEYANLSCIFADDVGRLKKTVALYQLFGNNTKVRKLSCNVIDEKPMCEVAKGFQAPEKVTNKAIIIVPKPGNASFVCETIPPEEEVNIRSCVLDVGTPQATQPPIGSNGNTEKVNNCQITPSTDPEYANITCIFADNVGRLNKAFALYQDFGNTTKEKVTCNVFEGKPICEASDGFQTPKTVTERAVFLVPNTRNASFICDTVPPAEGVENRGCNLDVGTPQATQPPIPNEGSGNTGWRGWHTGVVVVVLLIATGLVIAAVFWVRRKRSRWRASKPKPKDNTDNEESAETENLNQPGQGAELEPSAVITSAGASDQVDGLPDWCECGHCRQMPEEYDRLCCQMPEEYERLCCRRKPFGICLSTSQAFKDKVLERAKAWEPKKHEILHDDVNETQRKQAYTWFTEWRHGPLSKGVKAPVYNCCMWAVRDLMPDRNGKYTGFVKGPMICFKTEDFIARWGKHKT